MGEDSFILEERVLCSDDSCIGLVGADGRCKVCGTRYTGDETIPADDMLVKEMAEATLDAVDETPSPEPADEAERVCCSDDTCIGVIGEDGKCGTCGKLA